MSELDFAVELFLANMKILAVTGTNGKSNVATFAGPVLYIWQSFLVICYLFPGLLLQVSAHCTSF